MEVTSKIGVDHLVITPLISDDENGVVYGTPIEVKGTVNASVNPNSSVENDYADNGVFFATNNRGNTEMTLELIDVASDVIAQMLGQRRANGITIETPMDQSPYFAVSFRIWKAGKDKNGNNIYEYRCYAKGKFSVPNAGAETKTDSINFQHLELSAMFAQTQYIPEGQDTGTICASCRSDDEAVAPSVIENWFNAPVIQTSANLAAVTVAAAYADSKVTITGTKGTGDAFSFNKATAVAGETIIVTDSNGAIVDGAITFGGTSTAPTIVFTPDAGEEAPKSVTVTSGLKDNNNVGVTPKTISLA